MSPLPALALLCLALSTKPGTAAPGAEPQQELEAVQERLDSARKSRDEMETQKTALDEQLADIERKHGQTFKAVKTLEAEARKRTQRLEDLKRQRLALLASVERQHRALAGQARAAYGLGQRDWLKLLLNQEEPARLARVLAYYRYLNLARAALLQEIDRELAAAQRLGDELSQETQRLNETRQHILEERHALEESRRQRRGLLAQLEHQLRDKDAELRRLQEDEQHLRDLLTTLETAPPTGNDDLHPPSPAPDAHPTCPVQGRLVGQFGSPRMNGRWDGLLIAAEEGTPVRAVAEGQVVYSDWLRGYGLLTIVDHGDGVMSLYAYNQSLNKEVGERVAAGEVIATVGTSGGRAEPALYFGIREQGRAVNPLPWCNRAH